MDEVLKIHEVELKAREYSGQRIVTFDDIDMVHQKKRGAARRGFYRNKDKFIEGVDYYYLTVSKPNESAGPIRNIDVPNRGITVLTESGYLLLVKSFNDDLSWDVQRELVNSYFSVRRRLPSTDLPVVSPSEAPKQTNWFKHNHAKILSFCDDANCTQKNFISRFCALVSQSYDLDRAREIYIEEMGEEPEYVLDLLTYFPEIGEYAQKLLDEVCENQDSFFEKKKRKKGRRKHEKKNI